MASRASTTSPLAALAGSSRCSRGMWATIGCVEDAGESLAVPLAGSMTTTPLAPFPFLKALPKPLGSASFYGRRHTLRLLLRMKSELLSVGVRRRLATMMCCSLFQRVGAGHVEEVALWWLG
uniref:Uncharacterized protein n=1 Tax=Oryza glumipatula TaxID=40148 RepID=A0A0D9YV21_9ORYZ